MAERQKAQAMAFGAKTVTPITIADEAGTVTNINAVIERVEPTKQANKKELPDGSGGIKAVVYTDRRTTLTVEFWCAESDVATSESRQNTIISPGDIVTFDNINIPEIDDASHKFLVDQARKMNSFGDVRKIGLELTEYEADLSAEVAGE